MRMRAPQIIYIALSALALGITAAQHGQPRSGKENFWEMLLAIALHMGLLCWGGFFG